MKTLVEQLREISNNYPPRVINITDQACIEIKYVENLLVEIAKTGVKEYCIDGLTFVEVIIIYFKASGLKVDYKVDRKIPYIYFDWE